MQVVCTAVRVMCRGESAQVTETDIRISPALREWLAARVQPHSAEAAEDIRSRGWDLIDSATWLCGETVVEDESRDGVLTLRVMPENSHHLVVTDRVVHVEVWDE